METWKNSQEVPKKWANKFSKLLIRGFKQCWDFPGWDSHHLHQQLLDPLLGPWLIPNCTAQVGFSGGFSCWLLEDILHHFRGSLSEFIPWFTRFFFYIPQVVPFGISEPSTPYLCFFQFWVTSLCWICCRYWTFLTGELVGGKSGLFGKKVAEILTSLVVFFNQPIWNKMHKSNWKSFVFHRDRGEHSK